MRHTIASTIGLWLVSGSATAASTPTVGERAEWDTILDERVTVRCGPWQASKWCEARAILPASTEGVLRMMTEVEDLPQLFPSMLSMKQIAPDVYHQVIDYPFPYNDRDLVLAFSKSQQGATHIIQWQSTGAPPVPTVGVRLTHAQGRFELRPRSDGRTDLTYIWHGDIGPGVPEWIWPLAWKSQAREVVTGISSGLRDTTTVP